MTDYKKKMEASIKKWKQGYRVVVQCSFCQEEVHSTYSGEFKDCECGCCYIDQTPHYARVGGEVSDSYEMYFEELDQEKDDV